MHDDRATDDIDHHLIDGDILNGSSPMSPPMFSRQRARDNILNDNGDVEVHNNCVRIHPMVNDEIARGMV
jgi:hypothetical protein